MNARLKFNPGRYKRLAEIAQWLADGKNVQFRRTGEPAKSFGGHWQSWRDDCGGVETCLAYGCEFRLKP